MSSIQFILNSINTHSIKIPYFKTSKANICLNRKSVETILFPSSRLKFLNYFLFSIRFISCRADKSLAVGEYGLILCYLQKIMIGTPYVYFSDELILNKSRALKFILRKSIENCDFIISQDKRRKDFLIKEMGIAKNFSWTELPNVNFSPVVIKNSFHKLYSIPESRKIIHWSCSSKKIEQSGLLEFIKVSNHFNSQSDFHLLIRLRDEVNKIPENFLKGKNITVCYNPMPFELFETHINSIYINIISYYPYSNMGPNVNLIGKASGQMNLSLKHGIPIISEDLVGFDWLKKHNVGLFFKSIKSIDSMIKKIDKEHDLFSENCRMIFKSEISNTHFLKVFKQFLND